MFAKIPMNLTHTAFMCKHFSIIETIESTIRFFFWTPNLWNWFMAAFLFGIYCKTILKEVLANAKENESDYYL